MSARKQLISWRERQRRMRAALEDAWLTAEGTPEDPGLREAYAALPRAPIRLTCCKLSKDVNHGGLVRLAECFRLERVDLTPEDDGAVDFSANRGTKQYQPWRWIDPLTSISEAHSEGYDVAALTLTARSVPLEHVEWRFPMALVLGSELDGVPTEVEEACDFSVAIPLYGMVTSLNVVSATAIAVHSAVQAYRRKDADYQPARTASRRLLGLPPASFW